NEKLKEKLLYVQKKVRYDYSKRKLKLQNANISNDNINTKELINDTSRLT
ncbi:6290_t:CDS:1, partial [Racocetra persica]